nr:hypothetical protein [Candidatus Sigynarchaeota archaeon]
MAEKSWDVVKISLNWTIEVTSGCLGVVGVAIAVFVTFQILYKGIRYRYFVYSVIVWIFYLIYNLLWILSILFLSKIMALMSLYAFIPCGLFLLLESDVLSRESIDPMKLAIFTFLATTTFYTSLFPDPVFIYTLPNGEESITSGGLFRVFSFVTIL